jgi:hypothetical protein
MKTNFLFKLLLLAITCVSLYSCTADEITSTTKTKTDTSTTAKDGDPILTPPRK